MSDTKIFQCSVCGLHYDNEEPVKACEEFCAKFNACSIEITKHSIENRKSTA